MVRPSTDIALSQDRKRCNTQSGKITFPRVGKNEETQVWYLFGKPIVGFLAWESIDSHIISQGWVGESFPCVGYSLNKQLKAIRGTNEGWGSVARDNVQVEGVELIRCVNGCVTSLGTGPCNIEV